MENPGGKVRPCLREDCDGDHFLKVFSKMTHNLVDEDILVLVITTHIHGQIQDQMQHTSKVKATNEDCIILSRRYCLLPIYLSFVDQRESSTTLHQGREDDEHMAMIYLTLQ